MNLKVTFCKAMKAFERPYGWHYLYTTLDFAGHYLKGTLA